MKMPVDWFWTVFLGCVFLCSALALFFFAATRGALLLRSARGTSAGELAHVYPLYSNRWLMRLVDFQPIISAILLFQYHRLVSAITADMRKLDLRDKEVLITSCAFGNVIRRVVEAAFESGARRVLIADLVKNELDHARSKLNGIPGQLEFLEENATAMQLADNSVQVNLIFFLLHELPHPLKGRVLSEAARVLAPGGTLYLAEFSRPELSLLRGLSWAYFKVFEPLGLALWHSHQPLKQLDAIGGFTCQRKTYFFGNFQIIAATKNGLA